MDNLQSSFEQTTQSSRGTVDAVMESQKVWAAGFQNISEIMTAAAQAQFDHTLATIKAMSVAKTVKEAMDLQMAATRISFERALANTGKLSDASMSLVEQGIAPITAQMTMSLEKLAHSAA